MSKIQRLSFIQIRCHTKISYHINTTWDAGAHPVAVTVTTKANTFLVGDPDHLSFSVATLWGSTLNNAILILYPYHPGKVYL